LILLNGARCLSARLLFPSRGVWMADVIVDPLDAALVPLVAQPAVLAIGTSILTCTVDPSASSSFGDNVAVRVVGGRNGWGKDVSRQQFFMPAGALTSTIIYSATAALVGEAVVDASPVVYGKQYVRVAGKASSIFGDRDWYVDPTTGIANVMTWPTLPLPADAQILNWDLTQLSGSIASESLILPGMVLVDSRFNGATYTVREVEMVFDKKGATALVWASESLSDILRNTIRKAANTTYLAVYKYRVILPVPAIGFALQAITPGAPDLNPISQYPGLIPPGIVPSAEVLVGFVAGDPSQPYLAAPWTVGLTAALQDFATALNPGTLAANSAAFLAALATLQKAQ